MPTNSPRKNRLKTCAHLLLPAMLLSAAGAVAQSNPCAEIQSAKEHTYGFRPSKLFKEQRGEKSKQMDAFWELARKHGPAGLACVRQLLSAEKSDTYFLFDGASLLAATDKSDAQDNVIQDALLRTDLQDVDAAGYIAIILQLSKRGNDIGALARKYLHQPNATSFLPRHGAYKLDRTRGAILVYGSMPPALVDKYLSQEGSSTEPEVRETAAVVWSLNMTEESFRGIASLGSMKGFREAARDQVMVVRTYRPVRVSLPPKYTREQILPKMSWFPELDANIDQAEDEALDNSVYATLTPKDLDAVREARRKLITGVSNESVEGYMEFSRVLLNLINKLDLYKKYRIQ